jgi:hypothetical protein
VTQIPWKQDTEDMFIYICVCVCVCMCVLHVLFPGYPCHLSDTHISVSSVSCVIMSGDLEYMLTEL